jgi:hypothetical protein
VDGGFYGFCGFCGSATDEGWVSVRGALQFGSSDVALTWEPAEARTTKRRWRDIGRRGQVFLLWGRAFRRSERAATLCRRCGAVVIAPLPRTGAGAGARADVGAEVPLRRHRGDGGSDQPGDDPLV